MSYHSPRVVRANIFEADPNNNNTPNNHPNNNARQSINPNLESIGNTAPFNYIRPAANTNTLSPSQFNRPSTYNSSPFVASRESQRHFNQRGRQYISPRNPRHRRPHINYNNSNTNCSRPYLYSNDRSNPILSRREPINNISINNDQFVVSPKARKYFSPSTPKAPHPHSVHAQTPFIPHQTQPNDTNNRTNNNFSGYNHPKTLNTTVITDTFSPLNNITNTTNSTNTEDVIDLTTMDVPPLVTSPPQHIKRLMANKVHTQKDQDNDDNMTVASSLSPILSPNKKAKRSAFPSFSAIPIAMNHSMANFEINHTPINTDKAKGKKKKKKGRPKHCYNTRSNTYKTDPIDVDTDPEHDTNINKPILSDGVQSYCFSSSSNDSSTSDGSSSSHNTISSLWQSIDFNDKMVVIPSKIIQRGMCPIKGCTFKRKFKNERLMKQHICNIHLVSNKPHIYFLCKLCQTLYKEKRELEYHAKLVHHNHDGVQLLLNIFQNFCNDSFEIKCPEFKCDARFMVTKQAKNHMRDAHNYHNSDILRCKFPHNLVHTDYQCILNDQCKGKGFSSYNELVDHFKEWHFVKKQNAAKIANILRYKLVNYLDGNYKEFMKTWKEMMTRNGFLIRTKVDEYLRPKTTNNNNNNDNNNNNNDNNDNTNKTTNDKSVSVSHIAYSVFPIQGVNGTNIPIPTREQCRAALRTGICIDKALQSNHNNNNSNNNNNTNNSKLQIEKIADLIMFGCDDDGGITNLTLQDLDCLYLNHDGSKQNNGDVIRYSNVVDHYFSQHIQNQPI